MSRHPDGPARRTAPAAVARAADTGASSVAPEDRFFRHLVGSMRNGVIAIHRDGTIALMNDEAYRIFSLPRTPDNLGRPMAEAFRERAEVIRVFSDAFEMTSPPNRAELRLKDLDRVIGYTLSKVKDDHNEQIGAVLFFKDLTQVEQMEERERLRDRLASLGEMAAGIAHELKNPLAGIEVMAGLLRRQVPASADAQALLADIMSEAKLANAIVVEMLEFVRPIRLQVERTHLADVLHQAITLAEGKIPRGNVAVDVRLQPGLPPIVGDHHQLCQVFANLLINAFEALDGAGHVTIVGGSETVAPDPSAGEAAAAQRVVVDVVDDGPGVPEELSDQIFTPFFSTKPKGSGLGLPIVRKIVDAHEGRIDVAAVSGGGTRFRVTLPVSNVSSGASWFNKEA